MKYKNIKVTGHQRSGTHYIAKLISLNFLNSSDYSQIYSNHKSPIIVVDQNTLYIYTYRNYLDVAKSIFNMRKSFGLNNVKNFDDFLNKKYRDMWKPNKNFNINVLIKGNLFKSNYISKYFSKINKTPKEWHEEYYRKWINKEKVCGNILRVDYDNLKNNFEKEMLKVAKKLGINKKKFVNINKKIGWNI